MIISSDLLLLSLSDPFLNPEKISLDNLFDFIRKFRGDTRAEGIALASSGSGSMSIGSLLSARFTECWRRVRCCWSRGGSGGSCTLLTRFDFLRSRGELSKNPSGTISSSVDGPLSFLSMDGATSKVSGSGIRGLERDVNPEGGGRIGDGEPAELDLRSVAGSGDLDGRAVDGARIKLGGLVGLVGEEVLLEIGGRAEDAAPPESTGHAEEEACPELDWRNDEGSGDLGGRAPVGTPTAPEGRAGEDGPAVTIGRSADEAPAEPNGRTKEEAITEVEDLRGAKPSSVGDDGAAENTLADLER